MTPDDRRTEPPRPRREARWGVAACLAIVLAGAGPALAQVAGPDQPPRLRLTDPASTAAIAHPLTVSPPGAATPLPYSPANTGGMSGFARTALDHRFSPDHVTGSVGYLCGLHAGPDGASGPAASSDPVGTFLGAKLSYAF